MMQALGHAVGDGQTNTACDVALVQAALVKITHVATPGKPALPYLARYDGAFGKGTADAITAFQADRKLTGAGVTQGQVAPGDATCQALAAALPKDVADLRVLPLGKLVYLGATQSELSNQLTQAAGETFSATFRPKVTGTIRKLFTDNGIAVGVDPDGGRRSFERQRVIRNRVPKVTNAGPGESNHNFGGAVDLGFKGLRWLKPDGTMVTEQASWLATMPAADALPFWDALRAAGIASGAFRGPVGDRPHLQDWDDAGVSMVSRLAALLIQAGSMRWTAAHGGYSSDLGFGGALVPVGTAMQVWEQAATVDAATIRRLRAARPTGGAAGPTPPRPGQPTPHQPRPGQPHPPGGAAPAPHPTPADSSRAGPPGHLDHAGHPDHPEQRQSDEQEVAAMRQALRHEFELADTHWQDWTAH